MNTSVISWDDFFMGVAELASKRSKDPVTQVGACVVNKEKRILGVGYNGFPNGCSDKDLPWGNIGDAKEDTKYAYVCHAELNAICNSYNLNNTRDSTLYVTLFPCCECAKLIIQSGIKKVVYKNFKDSNNVIANASIKMFELANVEMVKY